MDEKLWIKCVRTIQKAGGFPIPVNDTALELTQTLMSEEEAKFLLNFKTATLNINQIKEKTGLDEKYSEKMLTQLMDKGIIFGAPSRST